jgi:AraC-like DNA-binding protein
MDCRKIFTSLSTSFARRKRKTLLSEEAKQLDMFGIAIRAGFNSRTTFYASFKKATGITPTEYMKVHSKQSN